MSALAAAAYGSGCLSSPRFSVLAAVAQYCTALLEPNPVEVHFSQVLLLLVSAHNFLCFLLRLAEENRKFICAAALCRHACLVVS